MMVLMSIQYIAPHLAINLHNFGYSEEQIGLAFGIPAILYVCTCPFMYLLTQKIQKRGIIIIGFIVITFAMLMIGGSDALIEFQKQPVFIFLGLCMIGLSTGMITIPVLPEMLESAESDPELAEKYDIQSFENLISGLFIVFQSIGEAAGPILSSALTEIFDFSTSQELFALILALFWILYFASTGCFKTCSPAFELKDESLEEQKQELVKVKDKTEEDQIVEEEIIIMDKINALFAKKEDKD